MSILPHLMSAVFQAALVPDTIIARTIPERGVLEWSGGILQIVVLLLGIGLLIAAIALLQSLRVAMKTLNDTVERFRSDSKPLIDNATAISRDAREVVERIRADIDHVATAAESIGAQLRDAAETTTRRVDDVNAVLDVLQTELEDTSLAVASAVRGARLGAQALSAGLDRQKTRRKPDPSRGPQG